MNGIIALGIQDFKRLLTNALFWVITVTLILIIVLVNFALPENISQENYRIFTYNADYLAGQAAAVSSEEELRQAVKESGSIGLLGNDDGGITVLNPGLSEKTVRAIMTMLYSTSRIDTEIENINESSTAIPFNKRMTPVFICFEALIIGFILGGALMLAEKEEGTIRAMRIAPMGVDRYLISKTVLFSIIAVLYALLMAVFCIGFDFSILRFVLLSFFGAAVFSLIGLAYTTFFRDMSSWFFSMSLLLSVNMLPIVAYSEPSFSPLWLKAIPSYSLIFAYENILFGMGRSLLPTVFIVACWCLGSYLISRFAVGRYLLLKGRG
ncbi:fluoroquinolone transport system permease protein [Anaerobacterium chartisolvens]|uniref:Fluoroquinolone transport system permease protein n=1 Tax=Anaerobacterium chartisolvens TaxID=1297424 RepID=A0A369AGL9_9FIRM|nr:ABC transporter permease [Anaerobacterium chartisolvens]RCX08499.1 fluoroquinolone transport system permease protein [Anaerobacterium chartisolvens]